MMTRRERDRERAIPQTSKPGPTFAVVAGTWMMWRLVDMVDVNEQKRKAELLYECESDF